MIDALVPPAKMTAPATSALSREMTEVGPAISAGQFRDALAYAATAVTVLATVGAAGDSRSDLLSVVPGVRYAANYPFLSAPQQRDEPPDQGKGEDEMTGSVLILDAESWEAADDFVNHRKMDAR